MAFHFTKWWKKPKLQKSTPRATNGGLTWRWTYHPQLVSVIFLLCLNQIRQSTAFSGRVLAICDHLWQSLDRRCLHYHVSLLHFLVQIPSVTTIETLLGPSSGASGVYQLVTSVLCEIVGYSSAAAIRFTHIGINKNDIDTNNTIPILE